MSLDGRAARLEVAMANTKEGMDLMEQSMGRSWRILGCRSKTFKRGCKVMSHEEFMKVLNMLTSLESRIEAFTKQ